MEKHKYSCAPLQQRLAAVFDVRAWQYLATHSNLCLAEGCIAGRKVLLVATDPAAALGTFGLAECADFRWAVLRSRAMGIPLVLLIDSAGARLDTGLPVQGALRALLREVLDARLAEVPMLAVLGRYAFGAASMLACAAHERLYSEHTLLVMSGPRVLQAALPDRAGHDTVARRINGIARSAVGHADRLIADDLDAYAEAVKAWVANSVEVGQTRDALMRERRHLRQRLPADACCASGGPILDSDGHTLRCLTEKPFGATDALALLDLAESTCLNGTTKPITIAVDCPGHSVLLQDEEIILSQYLVHLALGLRRLVCEGTPMRLFITGQISGGIYIALASAAATTELAPDAIVRTLPPASLVQIFGHDVEETVKSASYVEWGVVDAVLPSQHQTLINSTAFASDELFQR